MTKRLLHAGFLIPLLAFLIHQLLQYGMQIHLQLVDSYLDPFCAGALSPWVISIEREWLFRQQRLSKTEVIVIMLFLSIVSEFIFPYLSNRFTSDWIDVVAIGLGSIWYMKTR